MKQKTMERLSSLKLPITIGFVCGIALGVITFFLIIVFLGPYLGLPASAPKNATQIVVVVTQSEEVSKVSDIILTVEGILLGLSPLFFDKFGRAKLGASAMSVTAIALFLSLFTILFADTNANPNMLVWVYFTELVGFLFLAVFYVASAWSIALAKVKVK